MKKKNYFKICFINHLLRLTFYEKGDFPALSTIRRWIGQSTFLPGINNMYFSHAEKKFQHKSYKEKACT